MQIQTWTGGPGLVAVKQDGIYCHDIRRNTKMEVGMDNYVLVNEVTVLSKFMCMTVVSRRFYGKE